MLKKTGLLAEVIGVESLCLRTQVIKLLEDKLDELLINLSDELEEMGLDRVNLEEFSIAALNIVISATEREAEEEEKKKEEKES